MLFGIKVIQSVVEMSSWIAKYFAESSFHGLQYIFHKGFHYVEKLFWFGIVSCAVFCAVNVSLAGWRRHIYNPTVYVVENNYQNWRFPNVGITICPNYTDSIKNEELLLKFWNVTKSDEHFHIYSAFLDTLSKVNFASMSSLEPFSKYDILNNADFLALTREMKSTFAIKNEGRYATVITDMGICFTNSQLNKFQNPYGIVEDLNIIRPPLCHLYEECKTDIYSQSFVGNLYIHELRDFIASDNPRHIKLDCNKINGTITFKLGEYTAQSDVRDLSVDIRKCSFFDEGIFPYFENYTPALCLINCRIRAALKACGCRPFFYIIGDGPVCNITGMVCLSKTNWFDVSCNCCDLCSRLSYIFVSHQPTYFKGFEGGLSIIIQLPTKRISRRVVFSLDQFVVSIGGTASFFLGCSFISFVEIIFFVAEFIGEKLKTLFRKLFDSTSIF